MKEFKLSEKFLEDFQGKQPKWGFGTLSYITYKRTYARTKDDGTQEEFWETLKRVVEGCFTIQKQHCDSLRLPWDNRKAQRSAQIMFKKMWEFKFLPPGRGLWLMGTDAIEKKGSGGLNNCFAYETEILTRQGIKQIGTLVNQEVELLTNNGWVKAPIKSFGQQELYEIILTRAGIEKIIYATADHKWFVKDRRNSNRDKAYSTVFTKDLREGVDRLQPSFGPNATKLIEPSPFGIAHGFVFGDGTNRQNQNESNIANFIGQKDSDLKKYFINAVGEKASGMPNFFKKLPDINENKAYLLGWLMGYFAADGTCKNDGTIEICSYNRDNIEFIRSVCGVLGIGTYSIRSENRISNLTHKPCTAYKITLASHTLDKSFFLLNSHKQNYIVKKKINYWYVKSVTKTNKIEQVFCATVPQYHCFTLADNILTSNCGMVSSKEINLDFASPFCWAMDFLMLGVGIGFDTLGAGTIVIKKPAENTGQKYIIPDTREGWVEALRQVLTAFERGTAIPEFDYSLIREIGKPIKTFGGTSSGPEPLRRMLKSIEELLSRRIEQPITSVDIVDIFNFIGVAVVAGNVRRSAEIAQGQIDDIDFIRCKNPITFGAELLDRRWASNNSVFVVQGSNYEIVADSTAKNGEPGYIWLENARAYSRLKDAPDNKDYKIAGFNPCMPDYTWIMTANGPVQIKDLLNNEFSAKIDNIDYRATNFWHSGKKEIWQLVFKSGRTLELTPNHKLLTSDNKWIEAQNLSIGSCVQLANQKGAQWGPTGDTEKAKGWLVGSLLGDGYINDKECVLGYWGKNAVHMAAFAKKLLQSIGYNCYITNIIDRNEVRVTSSDLYKYVTTLGISNTTTKVINENIRKQSSDFYKGFIGGYFDADGSVQGDTDKGNSLRITSVNEDNLKQIQAMLLNIGINSSIYFDRRAAGMRMLPDSKGSYKEYYCQATHELIISKSNIFTFSDNIFINEPSKFTLLQTNIGKFNRKPNKEKFIDKLVKVIKNHNIIDVYDCTVDKVNKFDANGIIAHNCAEQGLESYELCNLVETFPANHDSPEEFYETLKYAYLYAKTVTLIPSHDPRTNAVMIRNRRIGTSMSGIEQAKKKFGTRRFYQEFCDKGYEVIKGYDKTYSDWLGIAKSIKVTTVKPSGTVSLLAGATPGVHAAHSKYYYRTMRLAHNSPLIKQLLNSGYYIEYGATEWKENYFIIDEDENYEWRNYCGCNNAIDDDSGECKHTTKYTNGDNIAKEHWKDIVLSVPVKLVNGNLNIPNFTGTLVVYFPMKEENFTKGKAEQTIWEQMENSAKMQYYWSDNSVSVTVNFKKDESQQIKDVLEQYEDRLKTVSFLPLDDHGYVQAPYITITEKQYNDAVSKLKDIGVIITSLDDKKIEGGCETDKCVLPAGA